MQVKTDRLGLLLDQFVVSCDIACPGDGDHRRRVPLGAGTRLLVRPAPGWVPAVLAELWDLEVRRLDVAHQAALPLSPRTGR